MKAHWPYVLVSTLIAVVCSILLLREWLKLAGICLLGLLMLIGLLGILMIVASLWMFLGGRRWLLALLSGVIGFALMYFATATNYWWGSGEGMVEVVIRVQDAMGLPVPGVVCAIDDADSGTIFGEQMTGNDGTCVVSGYMRIVREVSAMRTSDVLYRNRYALTIRNLHGEVLAATTISPTLNRDLVASVEVTIKDPADVSARTPEKGRRSP
jgi:hypothetical protein